MSLRCSSTRQILRAGSLLAAALALASCGETPTLSGPAQEPIEPLPPSSSYSIGCSVDVTTRELHCPTVESRPSVSASISGGAVRVGPAGTRPIAAGEAETEGFEWQDVAPSEPSPRPEIIGGQDLYVTLSSDAVGFDTGTRVFSADVRVVNLLPQAIGTDDGTTVTGIRVFFESGPTNGVTVRNADATGTFTGSDQPYFEWDEMLDPSEITAPRTWEWDVPEGVTQFSFTVFVDADVPHPDGFVTVSPDTIVMLPGVATTLTATARDFVGNEVSGRTFTWSSSNTGVVGVNQNGTIFAVSSGQAVVTASSDGPEADGQAHVWVGSADLEITTFDVLPDPVLVGQDLVHDITVTNHGPDPVTDVTLDLLVEGDVLIKSPGQEGCTDRFSTDPPAKLLSACPVGDLASGESRTLSLVLVPQQQGETLQSTAEISGYFRAVDPDNTNNQQVETTDVIQADLALTSFSASPNPSTVGGTTTLSATVENLGPDAVTGITLLVHGGAGATVSPASPDQEGCTFDDAPLNGGSFEFRDCVVGDLAPGESTTLNIDIITEVDGESFAVDATVAEGQLDLQGQDPDLTNNTGDIRIVVGDFTDLGVTGLSASPDPGTVDSPMTFSVTVENFGPISTAAATDQNTDVFVRIEAPGGANRNATPAACDFLDGQSTSTRLDFACHPDLLVGESVTFDIGVTPTAAQTITATAIASLGTSDQNPDNQSLDLTVNVNP